jgi:hypothetical protein
MAARLEEFRVNYQMIGSQLSGMENELETRHIMLLDMQTALPLNENGTNHILENITNMADDEHAE